MFALGLIYLAGVLAALAFYGRWFLRLLLPQLRMDAGLAIAFGIAVYLALCGLLELGSWASRPLLLGFVVAGALGFAVSLARDRNVAPPQWLAAGSFNVSAGAVTAFAVFGLLYLAFLTNAADWRYGFVDDLLGYLVYPERVLQEGSLGRDPFNYRRTSAGLTGGGYLYALFRAALPLQQSRLADVGVGSACLLLLLAGHARTQGLRGARLAGVLLVGLAVVAFSPLINNTPETLGKALLLGLLRLLFMLPANTASVRRGLACAPLVLAIIGLKTSFLPEAAAGFLAYYAALASRRSVCNLFVEAAATAAALLVLMLPWMIVSHEVADTFWYPLLGRGTISGDETAGFAAPLPYMRESGRLLIVLAPALLVSASVWRSPALQEQRVFLIALALTTTTLLLISQFKLTVFGYRYGHAGIAAALLFYLPIAGSCRVTPMLRAGLPVLLAGALVVMAMSKATDRPWVANGWLAEWILGRPANEGGSQWRSGRAGQLRAMQAAVPPGEPLLVLLSWPSLLDFRRNPIAVMDHPGKIGPPVRPATDDPLAWSRYLIRIGYRYVAYSYADEAVYTRNWARRDIERFTDPYWFSPFMVSFGIAHIQMRATLIALRNFGDVIYDDGEVFVVRLRDQS